MPGGRDVWFLSLDHVYLIALHILIHSSKAMDKDWDFQAGLDRRDRQTTLLIELLCDFGE